MKIGDLVRFIAPSAFSGSEREYAKSGIVTNVMETYVFKDKRDIACVYWSDGRRTTEYFCYLRKIQ